MRYSNDRYETHSRDGRRPVRRDDSQGRNLNQSRDQMRYSNDQYETQSRDGRRPERRDDSRDGGFKRSRESSWSRPDKGKFQKTGGRGDGRGGRGGRGRGGGIASKRREEKPEFFDSIVTKPENLVSKQAEVGDNDEVVKLRANYFQVKILNPKAMKMYKIQFEPNKPNPLECKILINNISQKLGTYVYDEGSCIYFLNDPPSLVFQSEMRDRNKMLKSFQITFKYIRDINFTEANFMQILNLVIRQSMKNMNFELVGKNHYDPKQSIPFPEAKLQIWPGFLTAIRQHENNLLLCCDQIFKVIHEDTMFSLIRNLRAKGADNETIKRQLRGLTVISSYNNKNYKIHDVDFTQSPKSTFKFKNDQKSYVDYYYETYNINIRNVNSPLLVSKPTAKDFRAGKKQNILLIPELCCPVGITDEMRNNFNLMKNIADKVRMTPDQRVQRILKFNNRLQTEGKQALIENQLEVKDSLIEFEGRKLPEQKIIFGVDQNQKPLIIDLRKANNTADWTSNLKDVVLYKPSTIKRWVYIYPRDYDKDVKIFYNNFVTAGKKLGMEISELPNGVSIHTSDAKSYIQKLEEYISKDYEFFLIILPRVDAKLYQAIKTTCFNNGKPVASQVVVAKTMHKGGLSVATKVAIQVNCKMGGIPWSISIPIKGLLAIGFSLSQNKRDKKNLYGAMVGSMRPGQPDGTFYGLVNPHSRGSNYSEFFGLNVTKMINRYKIIYNCFPESIIIYRDGVSDGQIQYVVGSELEEVTSNIKRLYEAERQKPKFGFIIINKKINTRIFSAKGNINDNPAPGTVVDDHITLSERYDFYLISQSVTQGTVAPTSYNIIHDELGLQAKDIQSITYKLCHLYFNWSGTIRVPSVVQYAQKLALLFGQHLELFDEQVLEDVSNNRQLYFL